MLQLEFQARNPSTAKKVVNFLEQTLGGEWWKVRESLKLLQPSWRPHLHALNSSTIAGVRSDVSVGLPGNWESRVRLETGEGCHHAGLGGAGPVHGGSHGGG